MKRNKMRFIWIAGLVLGAMAIVMFFYNFLISRQWIENPEPPGKLSCGPGECTYVTDRGTGSPAVVIMHDILSFSPEWWTVQKKLSRYTRVITYDRAGYGWSRGGGERTSQSAARELRDLLRRLDINGPCVLVGHGMGGLYAMNYAFLYPERVSALVLVDPITTGHGRFKKELRSAVYQNLINRTSYMEVLRLASLSGLIRSLNVMPQEIEDGSMLRILKNHYSLSRSYSAMCEEYSVNLGTSISQVNERRRRLSVPLLILRPSPEKAARSYMAVGLSLDEAVKIEDMKTDLMKDTASVSSAGRVISSSRATRSIHIEDPDLIVNNIRGIGFFR